MSRVPDIKEQVHRLYWRDDLNCATTTLLVLAERYEIPLAPQVVHAALGMHGAGGFRAQCGLVEGALMFAGILGRTRGEADRASEAFCRGLAEKFQREFGSLLCRDLRPEGFHPDNPPHLCESLTVSAIAFNMALFSDWLSPAR